MIKYKPATPEAYKLLHDGTLAFARVEEAGMRIDTEYLDAQIAKTEREIKRLELELREDEVYRCWQKVYGDRMNIDSRSQLGEVLFKHLKFPVPRGHVEGERFKTDEEALEYVDSPFVRKYQEVASLKKLLATNLKGIRNEVDANGFAHCSFGLNNVASYRSSCSDFNFQNLPIRDPALAALVRPCFIARGKRRVIVEVDFSGIEVRIAACYHKDPRMIQYIKDPTKDMHRDMASQIYIVQPKEVSKPMRHCGKNMFVFPSFYGDYYINSARAMWEAIGRAKRINPDTGEVNWTGMALPDGTDLYTHLARQGITSLGALDPQEKPLPGTFEHHMKEVENDFWNNRFKVYGQWKKTFYEEYLRRGWFDMYTGFVCRGHFTRNQVLNYSTQGASFHCNLKSVIYLTRWLEKYNMRSRVIGQIHDSIVADVHLDELQDYLDMAKYIMTERIPALWPWIIVPLAVEAEVAPAGESWHKKKAWHQNEAGVWTQAA